VHRILLERRGIRIWSYPAFLYVGLVAGIVVQNLAANAGALDAARVYVATLILLPVALAGARLLYVAAHWPVYRREPRRIWRHAEGGMSMFGGVPCMLLASVPLLAWFELPFWRYWDVSTFCILTGMFFARIGCLLNGCCAGRASESPIAFWLPDAGGVWQRRLPVQLLEASVALLLLAAATLVWPLLTRPGALFLLVVVAYSLARAVLQSLRADREHVAGFDLQRGISLALVGFALIVLLFIR
jgi:phosphatidylglycerol---prolipoprotein diacylglyceryl transferase